MLKIETFVVNMIQENCYIVSDETHETVIIDCGAFYDNDKERIKAYIEKNELVPVHSIFTHGHFDHIIGSKFLFDTYGIKPEISAKDTDLYYDCEKQLNDFVGLNINLQLPNINKIIDDKYKINQYTRSYSWRSILLLQRRKCAVQWRQLVLLQRRKNRPTRRRRKRFNRNAEAKYFNSSGRNDRISGARLCYIYWFRERKQSIHNDTLTNRALLDK